MRASDFVTQLATKLPTLVDDFTTNFPVTSLTRAGTTVTVTTGVDHGLVVGASVNIVGAITPIVISTLSRVGIVGTLVTATNHDMTEGVFITVVIDGATEPEFNGTFELIKDLNRKTVTFKMLDSGPTVATGSPLLLNGSAACDSYNGLQAVTVVPITTTFEYEILSSTLFTPASGTISAKTLPRISAAVSFNRIMDAYTKQAVEDAWLFVVLGDGIAHKNRQIEVDSTDNLQRAHFFSQRLSQTISFFVFLPTSEQIAARKARDRAEELLRPICQSVLFRRFDSLLFSGEYNPLQLTEHGFQEYTTAFYAHRYTFEATLQMSFDDTVGFDEDVAFRDIFLNTDIFLDSVPKASPLFTTIWDTGLFGVTNNNQILLPLESTGSYDFVVNWGDGSTDTITAWDQAEVLHDYGQRRIGILVVISGEIDGFRFGGGSDTTDANKLLEIVCWGQLLLGNTGGYFHGCTNLKITAEDILNTSGTTNMFQMFLECSSLTGIPNINTWNMSNVTSLSTMFVLSAFNSDVGDWDVSNVTNMFGVFGVSQFNQNIGSWDVSSVTDMDFMFLDAPAFDRDISNWNVSNVSTMADMLSGSAFSTNNYDLLLVAWEQLTLQNGVSFNAGSAQYSAGAPATARADIISNFSWVIVDGGQVP